MKTPPPFVPINIVPPAIAMEVINILVRPIFIGNHVVPWSDERKIPPPRVPAKMFCPTTASDHIVSLVSPEFIAIQCVPESDERKTPPLSLPANIFGSLIARCCTLPQP